MGKEAQDVPDVVRSLKLGSSGRFATTRSDFQVRKKESSRSRCVVSA